jgi:predicted DNA-binding transcriptional regulator AlpA
LSQHKPTSHGSPGGGDGLAPERREMAGGGADGSEEQPLSDDGLSDWLTTREVAALTGLDKVSVRRYVLRGVMPKPVHKGNFLLWRRADIEVWMANRRPMGRPKKA